MRMSSLEIVTEACSELNFPYSKVSSTSYFTTTELLRWLNRAQSEFVEKTRCLKYRQEFSTQASVQEYAITPTITSFQVLDMVLEGQPLTPTSVRELDAYDLKWRQAAGGPTGQPEWYYLSGIKDSEIGFFNCPDAVYSVEFDFLEVPPLITQLLSTIYPKIDDAWHDALTFYIERNGFRKKKEWSAVKESGDQWNAKIASAKSFYRKLNTKKTHIMSGPEELNPTRTVGVRFPTNYGVES